MPQGLPGSQGFMSGFTTGLVHTILGKQKDEEDQFRELKNQRAKMLAGLADQVRQEDLPKLIEGLDGVISAKTPDKANAAFGNVLGNFITEQYAQEEEAQARNAQIGQSAQEQQAQYQDDLAQGGSLVGTVGGVPSRIPVREPDPVPVKLNPNKYAEGKVRLKTEEGNQRRAIKSYAQKEAALYKEKTAFEEKRQEEIRETNKQKIEQNALTKGAQKLGWTEDEAGNAVLHYKDPKLGVQSQTFEGMKLPSSVTQEMRGATQIKVQQMRTAADKEKWTATLAEEKRVNDQKILESKKKIDEIQHKITTGYYNKTNNAKAVANIVTRYKSQLSGVDSQLGDITSQINRIMGLDEALVPWEEKKARLEPLYIEQDKLRRYRATLDNLMEIEVFSLTEDEQRGTVKESGGKVNLNNSNTSGSGETKNKKPTLTKSSVLSTLGVSK